MVGEYIGARYVPKFMGVFDETQQYEALCVVDNGSGTSYISKVPTPAGTPLTNSTYWAIYGATSGAIIDLQKQINKLPEKMAIVDCEYPPSGLSGLIPDTNDDNTAALQNLVDYCATNKKILLLHGIYSVAGRIIIPSGSIIIGSGGDYSQRDTESALTKASAVLKRIGNNSDSVLETDPRNVVSGVSISGIGIYCNNIAEKGIMINRMRNSYIHDITVTDATIVGIHLKPNGSTPNDNIMFNNFSNIYVNRSYDGIYIDPNEFGNSCYNYFENIRIDFYHCAGIFTGGDNNVFVQMSCYGRGSNIDTYPWHFNGAGFVSNVFYHLTGRPSATNGSVNSIYEYDNENNEGQPFCDSTSKLFYTSNSRNGYGVVNSYPTSKVTIPLADCHNESPNYYSTDDKFVLLRGNNGVHAAFGLDTTDRTFDILFSSDGSTARKPIRITKDSIYLDGHRITYSQTGQFVDGDIKLSSDVGVDNCIGEVYYNGAFMKFGALV